MSLVRMIDHVIDVPLDHDAPGGPTIELYARELIDHGGDDRAYLVFLQGGPGGESPRPTKQAPPAWITRALRDYRVLLLDQRGTGRSTPVSHPDQVPGETPADQAAYLTHFRADSIVGDCELLREHLGAETWSLLGQSFGGFTSLTYLSHAPQSLAAVYVTGGLSAIGGNLAETYDATFATMRMLAERFYARFPGDRDRMRRALESAAAGEVRGPWGAIAPRLLRTVGSRLGFDGGDEQLHHLLERDPSSTAFAYDLVGMLPFTGRNPLYSLLQEACYADRGVTDWASERALPTDFDEDPTLLFGEHLSRWHFEDTPQLAPWLEIMDVVAAHEWPRLYDEAALREADVPVAAIVYYDDPFVDRELSLRTASLLPRAHTWITNEYLHGGLVTSGEGVIDRLITIGRDL